MWRHRIVRGQKKGSFIHFRVTFLSERSGNRFLENFDDDEGFLGKNVLNKDLYFMNQINNALSFFSIFLILSKHYPISNIQYVIESSDS